MDNNILEIAKRIADNNYSPADCIAAAVMTADQIRELSVACMQQAAQFSKDPAVAAAKPLNHPDAYPVRSNMVLFVMETLDHADISSEPGQHWRVRLAEYARRWAESETPERLQMAADRGQMIRDFSNLGIKERSLAAGPRVFAQSIINAVANPPQSDLKASVRGPLAYEQTYWLTMDKKFAEAKAANLEHAAACRAKDPLGATVFELQAAKCGIDGMLEGAASFAAETYENALPALQENRAAQLAQSWIKPAGTLEAHIGQAAALDPSLAARFEALRANLALVREGRFEGPDIGGM